jgi:hypothetical protein
LLVKICEIWIESHEKFWWLGTLACLQRASNGFKKASINSTSFSWSCLVIVLFIEAFLKPFDALCRQANVPNRQKKL